MTHFSSKMNNDDNTIIVPAPQQSIALLAAANADLQLPPPITNADVQDLALHKRQGKA